MRKKILSLAMLLLLIISVLSVLNVNIVEVSAQPYPVITFAPETIVNTTANLPIDHVFNWPISTDYIGDDIWGYELTITYNPVVLNVLNVTNGDLIINTIGDSGATFINGSIDNTSGKLSVTSAFFYYDEGLSPPVNVTSGDGTLVIVKFKVTGEGDSDVTFGPETKLIGWNASTDEEYNIVDDTMKGHTLNGYFANTKPIHNVRVNNIWLNDTLVQSGEIVNVTVNVENTGNVTERFDVTAYFGTLPIETQTITLGVTSQNRSFIWDTTSERGNITISAEASDVGSTEVNETSTTDNTKVDGKVMVIPPTLAVWNSTGDGHDIIDITMSGGDTFFVTINITNAYKIDTIVFNLTWTDAIIRPLDIVKGDFFEGVSHAFGVSNDTGYAVISYNRTGGGAGLNGNGSIANITFTVVTKGGSLITLKPYPVWWTTYWATTPVLIHGVYSNYYDMQFHGGATGNYLWHAVYNAAGETWAYWVYPTWGVTRVTVTPKNNGFLYMTYNLTIYANGAMMATEFQTLVGKQHTPDNKRTYTLDLNFTNAAWGKYFITANISDQDPNLDDSPENDDYVWGTPVTVRIPGDTDGSSNVTFADFITFAADYGKDLGEAGYDIVSDITGDGSINFSDFIKFAANYGKKTTSYP